MLNIKLIKVVVAFVMIFFTIVTVGSVMAGGLDNCCQCGLIKNDANKDRHIYICQYSKDYVRADLPDDAVQLSGFLDDISECSTFIRDTERANKVLTLHESIKSMVKNSIEFPRENIVNEIFKAREVVMGGMDSLMLCPFTTKEISEIVYYIDCVVGIFCDKNEGCRRRPWLLDKDGRFQIAFSSALSWWYRGYGGKSPTTKDDRKIFHSIIIYILLTQYMCSRDDFMDKCCDEDTEIANLHSDYMISVMAALRTKYHVIFTDVYASEDYSDSVHNPVQIDSYAERGKFDVFGQTYYSLVTWSVCPLFAMSEYCALCLQFVAIKSVNEPAKIRSIVTPGFYEFTSTQLNFADHLKALYNKIQSCSSQHPSVWSVVKDGVQETIGYGYNLLRKFLLWCPYTDRG
ncbi:MAG: hypothetical protein QS721_07935 [Candidatus Endonucleobacter sp. (ex Gigantidas childressi)]|nr:hypothetical protein [Candidatus Endonucleobacter sp. (ex Gigantidas childressi)]